MSSLWPWGREGSKSGSTAIASGFVGKGVAPRSMLSKVKAPMICNQRFPPTPTIVLRIDPQERFRLKVWEERSGTSTTTKRDVSLPLVRRCKATVLLFCAQSSHMEWHLASQTLQVASKMMMALSGEQCLWMAWRFSLPRSGCVNRGVPSDGLRRYGLSILKT